MLILDIILVLYKLFIIVILDLFNFKIFNVLIIIIGFGLLINCGDIFVDIFIIFVIVLLLGNKLCFLGIDILGFVEINVVLFFIFNVVIVSFLYVICLLSLIII